MIYLDNAATTKVYDELLPIFTKYQTEQYFNPSAPYKQANEVSVAIEKARKSIASVLGAQASEIVFGSSGSECDNIAIFCSKKNKNGNIVTSKCEHAAVYQSICELGGQGYEIRYVPTCKNGAIDIGKLAENVDENTVFASFMHVNNETGAVNDIKEICRIIKSVNTNTIVHSDGVQALGKIPINVKDMNVDLYTVSSHKVHAPKGCGALYVKKSVYLKPFIFGGGQENNIRSSTQNVGAIICFSIAAQKITQTLSQNTVKIQNFSRFLRENLSKLGYVISDENCVPNIVYVGFEKIRGEVLAHALCSKNILIGTGSACNTHKKVSRIAECLQLEPSLREGVVRISLSEMNTMEECETLLRVIQEEITILREYERK